MKTGHLVLDRPAIAETGRTLASLHTAEARQYAAPPKQFPLKIPELPQNLSGWSNAVGTAISRLDRLIHATHYPPEWGARPNLSPIFEALNEYTGGRLTPGVPREHGKIAYINPKGAADRVLKILDKVIKEIPTTGQETREHKFKRLWFEHWREVFRNECRTAELESVVIPTPQPKPDFGPIRRGGGQGNG